LLKKSGVNLIKGYSNNDTIVLLFKKELVKPKTTFVKEPPFYNGDSGNVKCKFTMKVNSLEGLKKIRLLFDVQCPAITKHPSSCLTNNL